MGRRPPCPHRLPSCLPPPPLPDPGGASQTLCSRGWELLGGGSPGKRSSCATRKGRDSRLTLGPSLPHTSPPVPTAPSFASRCYLSEPDSASPRAPAPRHSPCLHSSLPTPPPPPRSRGRGWERQMRGGGESTARRIPGDAFRPGLPGPAAEEGVFRRRRRAEGPHPHRVPAEPWGSQAPSWREGDTVVRVREANCKRTPPSSPTPPSRARPSSPLHRARPEGSRDRVLSTVTTIPSFISYSDEGGAT